MPQQHFTIHIPTATSIPPTATSKNRTVKLPDSLMVLDDVFLVDPPCADSDEVSEVPELLPLVCVCAVSRLGMICLSKLYRMEIAGARSLRRMVVQEVGSGRQERRSPPEPPELLPPGSPPQHAPVVPLSDEDAVP